MLTIYPFADSMLKCIKMRIYEIHCAIWQHVLHYRNSTFVLTRRSGMARGSSYGDQPPLQKISATTQVTIRRATRILPEIQEEVPEPEVYAEHDESDDRRRITTTTLPAYHKPLARHRSWITTLVLST